MPIPSDVNSSVAANVSKPALKDTIVRGIVVAVSVLKLLVVFSRDDSVVSGSVFAFMVDSHLRIF